MARQSPRAKKLPSNAEIAAFQRRIHSFYQREARTFPLPETKDPYAILVSELMLQQTQTKRVLDYYPRFLRALPSFTALANAALAKVLTLWQGLGYNRRGRNLWLLAKEILERFGGQLPRDSESLLSLPGVGPYTAAALQAFVFGLPTPMIETNIRTVFISEFFPKRRLVHDKEILALVERTIDRRDPRVWFYALMDYGVHIKRERPSLNKRSKHYKKQSTFKGSVRQVRGALLRQILAGNKASLTELSKCLGKSHDELEAPIQALIAEGLIERRGRMILAPGTRIPKTRALTNSIRTIGQRKVSKSLHV